MVTVLSLINYSLLLIFGVLLSVQFAGVQIKSKNLRAIVSFVIMNLLLQAISWQYLGYDATKKIYPIIVHIPLTVFIHLVFKRSRIIAFVSVLTAYLCCQTPRWFATMALYFFNNEIIFLLVNSVTILPVLYLLDKYVVSSVNRLMQISKRALLLFGIIPFMYYVFDYSTTVYTDLLYQGIEIAVLFMPSLVSMFYFIFIILYYNEIQRRSNAESERVLMTVQINQAKKELAALLELQEKTAIYRHDMRHHLNLIGVYLADGDAQKAIDYIYSTQTKIAEITPIRYCENNTVNLILSHFATQSKLSEVIFTVDVQIPQNIEIEETELCSLLSNALENALNACSKVNEKPKFIHINCKVHKGKLLVFIENSYAGEIVAENGIPKSNLPGHGFGTKSMVIIIDKYKGYYSYVAKDGIFTLRIVLPLM